MKTQNHRIFKIEASNLELLGNLLIHSIKRIQIILQMVDPGKLSLSLYLDLLTVSPPPNSQCQCITMGGGGGGGGGGAAR